jgi:hypothetical protein
MPSVAPRRSYAAYIGVGDRNRRRSGFRKDECLTEYRGLKYVRHWRSISASENVATGAGVAAGTRPTVGANTSDGGGDAEH